MPTSAAGSHAPVSVQTSTSQGPSEPGRPAGLSDPARGHPAVDVNGHSARSPRPAAANLAVASPDRARGRRSQPPRSEPCPRPVAGTSEPVLGLATPASGHTFSARSPRRLVPGRDRAAGSTSVSRSPQATSGPAGPLSATQVASRSGPTVQRHEVSSAPVAQATWSAQPASPAPVRSPVRAQSAAQRVPAWAETPDVPPTRSEASLQRTVGTAPSLARSGRGPPDDAAATDVRRRLPDPGSSPRRAVATRRGQRGLGPDLASAHPRAARRRNPARSPNRLQRTRATRGSTGSGGRCRRGCPRRHWRKGKPTAAELDELAKRLYEPLSARLRTELWLDRERSGRSMTR